MFSAAGEEDAGGAGEDGASGATGAGTSGAGTPWGLQLPCITRLATQNTKTKEYFILID